MSLLTFGLTVWGLVWVLQVSLPAQEMVRLPRELFACLRREFDSPEGFVRLPAQAKRWAVELSERQEIEIVCGGRTWVVRVE